MRGEIGAKSARRWGYGSGGQLFANVRTAFHDNTSGSTIYDSSMNTYYTGRALAVLIELHTAISEHRFNAPPPSPACALFNYINNNTIVTISVARY